MKKTTQSSPGFTLLEIVIVVALVGLLAAIAIPNMLKARARSQANICISNLRKIQEAKQQWAFETRKPSDAVPLKSDLALYLGRSGSVDKIACPADPTEQFDNSYNINPVTEPPSCKLNQAGAVSGHILE
ncbi:MAG: type II secretion system GspH family protein [Verrucomicrobiae bacterium]|nr:type II secretion system GspH family protein [Verrucomicrobiae bacterium]